MVSSLADRTQSFRTPNPEIIAQTTIDLLIQYLLKIKLVTLENRECD